MTLARRKWTNEERLAAVKRVLGPEPERVADVADELGVHEVTLYDWRRKLRGAIEAERCAPVADLNRAILESDAKSKRKKPKPTRIAPPKGASRPPDELEEGEKLEEGEGLEEGEKLEEDEGASNRSEPRQAIRPPGLPVEDASRYMLDAASPTEPKLRWDLLPLQPVEEAVRSMTVGARKHGDRGYLGRPDAQRKYMNAIYRHLAAWRKGEERDPDDGAPHLAAVLVNAAILRELEIESGRGRR